MEKLKMTLESNGKIVLEGESNYRIVNNKLIFRIDESNYIIDIYNNTFTKNDHDTSILIDLKNKTMYVRLTNHPGQLEFKLSKNDYIQDGNNITINYSYNLEEEMNNSISILLG